MYDMLLLFYLQICSHTVFVSVAPGHLFQLIDQDFLKSFCSELLLSLSHYYSKNVSVFISLQKRVPSVFAKLHLTFFLECVHPLLPKLNLKMSNLTRHLKSDVAKCHDFLKPLLFFKLLLAKVLIQMGALIR